MSNLDNFSIEEITTDNSNDKKRRKPFSRKATREKRYNAAKKQQDELIEINERGWLEEESNCSLTSFEKNGKKIYLLIGTPFSDNYLETIHNNIELILEKPKNRDNWIFFGYGDLNSSLEAMTYLPKMAESAGVPFVDIETILSKDEINIEEKFNPLKNDSVSPINQEDVYLSFFVEKLIENKNRDKALNETVNFFSLDYNNFKREVIALENKKERDPAVFNGEVQRLKKVYSRIEPIITEIESEQKKLKQNIEITAKKKFNEKVGEKSSILICIEEEYADIFRTPSFYKN